MSRALIVRAATPVDVDGIFQVMRQSRQTAFSGLLPPDALDWDTKVSDEFRQFINGIRLHDGKSLLVAVRDDQVRGVAELVWAPGETSDFIEAEEAELVAIHVRPDDWDQGIGSRLLTEALTRLPSHLTSIALCVLNGNERARTFYEQRGFDRVGMTVTTYEGDEYEEAVYRRPL
ncbi:GNAT family N-acetyltransferase [Natrialbaceae archaeon A-CW2]